MISFKPNIHIILNENLLQIADICKFYLCTNQEFSTLNTYLRKQTFERKKKLFHCQSTQTQLIIPKLSIDKIKNTFIHSFIRVDLRKK